MISNLPDRFSASDPVMKVPVPSGANTCMQYELPCMNFETWKLNLGPSGELKTSICSIRSTIVSWCRQDRVVRKIVQKPKCGLRDERCGPPFRSI